MEHRLKSEIASTSVSLAKHVVKALHQVLNSCTSSFNSNNTIKTWSPECKHPFNPSSSSSSYTSASSLPSYDSIDSTCKLEPDPSHLLTSAPSALSSTSLPSSISISLPFHFESQANSISFSPTAANPSNMPSLSPSIEDDSEMTDIKSMIPPSQQRHHLPHDQNSLHQVKEQMDQETSQGYELHQDEGKDKEDFSLPSLSATSSPLHSASSSLFSRASSPSPLLTDQEMDSIPYDLPPSITIDPSKVRIINSPLDFTKEEERLHQTQASSSPQTIFPPSISSYTSPLSVKNIMTPTSDPSLEWEKEKNEKFKLGNESEQEEKEDTEESGGDQGGGTFTRLASLETTPYLLTSPTSSSRPPGLKGLMNLGNTCFMNSALQCMSNTPHLILEYFVSDVYRSHINPTNPLGLHGEIAEAFADFMKTMWSTHSDSIVSPKHLRWAIAKFAPQFRSFYQHDAQELLGFLLDGLHEDLNLVHKKPYVEVGDFDHLPSNQKAAKLWEVHRARNNSIIVDAFQGQYQSTLHCLNCSKQSVTFDPFMILTLPIPSRTSIREKQTASLKKIVEVQLIVVPFMDSHTSHLFAPFQTKFYCDANATTSELMASTFLPQAHATRLMVCQDHQVIQVLQPTDTLKELDFSDDDIVFLLHELPMMPPSSPVQLPSTTPLSTSSPSSTFSATSSSTPSSTPSNFYLILEQEMVPSLEIISSSSFSATSASSRVGMPILLCVPTSMTEKELYEKVLETMLLWTPVTLETLVDRFHSSNSSLSNSPNSSSSSTPFSLDQFFHLTYTSSSVYSYSSSTHSFSASSSSPLSSIFSISSSSSSSSSVLPSSWHRCTLTWSTSLFQACFETEALWFHLPSSSITPPFALSPPSAPPSTSTSTASSRSSSPLALPLPRGSSKTTSTLEDCFKQFSMLEQLTDPHDLVYCSKCQSHQPAEKKVDLFRLPPLLVITLKRFGAISSSSSSSSYMFDSYISSYRQKLTDLVTFPFQMQLFDVPSQTNYTYELYAVSNHYGSLAGGHYTAYAKNPLTQQWYEFDDTRVSKVTSESQIQSEAAYVLFYQRTPLKLTLPTQPSSSLTSPLLRPVSSPIMSSASSSPCQSVSPPSPSFTNTSASMFNPSDENDDGLTENKEEEHVSNDVCSTPPMMFDSNDSEIMLEDSAKETKESLKEDTTEMMAPISSIHLI